VPEPLGKGFRALAQILLFNVEENKMTRPTMKDWGYTDEFSVRDSTDHSPWIAKPDELEGSDRYWGKYQGSVVLNIDPEKRLRLFVNVPEVWGLNFSSWALPCLPYGGLSLGMYIIPPVGAHVWVEFENGNPDYPIWTGFFYDTMAEVPTTAALATPGAPIFAIESFLKNALVISDTPLLPDLPLGGILLKSGEGSYIAIDIKGIRIIGKPGVIVNGETPFDAALYVSAV
jgi:Type VI secretion system/phage-baseplate injector OB domain